MNQYGPVLAFQYIIQIVMVLRDEFKTDAQSVQNKDAIALLPQNQQTFVIQRTSDSKRKEHRKSGLYGLFRYASGFDYFLLFFGSLFAILHGACMPVLAIVFGQMTNTFIQSPVENSTLMTNTSEDYGNGTSSISGFMQNSGLFALYYLFIGIGALVAGFFQTYCWELASERQVYALRNIFFAQLLRQDTSWFDVQQGDLTTKLTNDIERIREGIGSKMSMVLQYLSTFITGIFVGIYANVKLTLVILAISPVMMTTSAFIARTLSSSSAREQIKYSAAGKIAEEVIANIKTVFAFCGEKKEIKRFESGLEEGRKIVMIAYYKIAVGLAAVYIGIYFSTGCAFWYGSHLLGLGETTPGSVFTVFFSVMQGSFALGNALPFVNAASTAVGSASTIFEIIDRIPLIDSYSTKGFRPQKIIGFIRFEDVVFNYPARPSISILRRLNLSIPQGISCAIVGASGAGKSTIVSLLLRMYDPNGGKIFLDGIDVRDLNLPWLRSQIGLVSQEPILFGVSILENIRYGREDVSYEDIISASKMANAHSFIEKFPHGYDTLVGDRGMQMSGGQKQRIAIARALVRNPQILLLDEATSALDAQSEAEVQKALDSAMAGRTTIIVAHRLSTIKNANLICAMKDGNVFELGTHDELMEKKGLYYSLVKTQKKPEEETTNKVLSEDTAIEKLTSDEKGNKKADIPFSKVTATEDEKLPNVTVWRVIKFNSAEWPWLLLGFIGSILTGSVMPIFAYFYGEIFATFQLTGEELARVAVFWTLMFLALGLGSAAANAIQLLAMVQASEKLIVRFRLRAFENILTQSVGWFDMEKNSSGILLTRLAKDAPLVKAAAGLRAGQFLSAGVTLFAAMFIAFINGWKLSLLLVIAVPLIIGAYYQQLRMFRQNQIRDSDLTEGAGRIAYESIRNIQTVQALGKEKLFLKMYTNLIDVPFREAKNQAILYSLVFAFSQSVIYMMYAASFKFGTHLIEKGEMYLEEVYKVFFALSFCATSVGQSAAYLQDYARAKLSAALMFQLIEAKTDIHASPHIGIRPEIHGKISFKDVHFRYPARPELEILRGLNLEIEPGKTVAFVGSSGGGKSTIVSLLLRFYDPQKGSVCVDDVDIRAINLPHLRKHIGIVTQEPILFGSSILENIAYGVDEVNMDEIVAAATMANIHTFITNLPQGYNTLVGDNGTQLSGGQKQRIAIARALIKNPKILILDEATSALDAQSEKKIKDALERAREGRTCIIIAHRLSTIQNADKIAVLSNGVIAEIGTHHELLNRRNIYYNLTQRQR